MAVKGDGQMPGSPFVEPPGYVGIKLLFECVDIQEEQFYDTN